MKSTEAYRRLLEYSRETALYESMRSLMGWDQRTYLPESGNSHRSNQIAAITALLHRRAIDPWFGEMLAAAESSATPAAPLSDEAVNLREWRRNYDRAIRVPEALAVEVAKAASEGELAWKSARPENNWKGFLPYLNRIVSLKREQAAALSTRPGEEIYDALIEGFEPGENAKSIEELFDTLAGATFKLIERIGAGPRKPDPAVLIGNSPEAAQKLFIDEVIRRMGFDLRGGRVDRSAHPFTTTIGPGDVRITNRFEPDSFVVALFGSIHETGHALYEQGLPVDHWGTPRGTAVSMAVHESQSLMWENMIGKSRAFWNHFYPVAIQYFPWLQKVDAGDFIFALNEVRPSLIRTEADEVTYNLHIILRFDLERMLIGGRLEPADLPEAWNAGMDKYLGLVPPDFTDGVMQDIHWAAGEFGYFPSYALGNIYAAQFLAKATEKLGDLPRMFEAGELWPFLRWFRENVHSPGSRHIPRELVKAATGEDLTPNYLIRYLERKYGELYGF